jgi:hypothetical protein
MSVTGYGMPLAQARLGFLSTAAPCDKVLPIVIPPVLALEQTEKDCPETWTTVDIYQRSHLVGA